MGIGDAVKALFGDQQPKPHQQPQSYPEHSGMYASWEQEDLKGIVGVTLDNSSLLLSIEMNLRGQIYVEERNPETGQITPSWKNYGEKKMNELGIQAVIMEVRSFLDKNIIMGYMPNQKELDKAWLDWSIEFGLFLAGNKQRFEILPSYRGMLAKNICHQVRWTMFRSLEGNEKEGVYKQVRRIEQTSVMGDERRLLKQSNNVFKE